MNRQQLLSGLGIMLDALAAEDAKTQSAFRLSYFALAFAAIRDARAFAEGTPHTKTWDELVLVLTQMEPVQRRVFDDEVRTLFDTASEKYGLAVTQIKDMPRA